MSMEIKEYKTDFFEIHPYTLLDIKTGEDEKGRYIEIDRKRYYEPQKHKG